MEQILIIDLIALEQYDSDTFHQEFLGGTESTIVRIAEQLQKKVTVVVAQKNRIIPKVYKNLAYIPYTDDCLKQKWKAIIFLRFSEYIYPVVHQYPNTPIWIWLHDNFVMGHFLRLTQLSQGKNIGYIVVSEFHKKQFENHARIDPYFRDYRLKKIYNPIDDHLKEDGTKVDPFKLIFSSSLIKGFLETVAKFGRIRNKYPQFHLVVTYKLDFETKEIPGVTFLGGLSHQQNLQEIRSSLCLLSLNSNYPETFGLAMVEANAVGRPVLAHPLGSLPEVLMDQSQFVNTHDIDLVIEKLLEWQKVDPKVTVKDEFRLSNVVKEWERILEL